MYQPSGDKLEVFISGVEKEFGDIKSRLHDELKERYHLSSYASERDKESDFDKTWGRLEKKIIDSDIFVLFLGDEFGSPSDDDISITQKEYYTARDLNKPIIVFRKKSNKFENDSQEKFYNEVRNFDKDQRWAPTIKDFGNTEELSGKIIKHIYSVAKEAMPALNDEDEVGNFWLKPWVYQANIDCVDPNEGTISLDTLIIIQNRDTYSHIVTDIWINKFDSKHELNRYGENLTYRRKFGLGKTPLKVFGRDKKMIYGQFLLKVPPTDLSNPDLMRPINERIDECVAEIRNTKNLKQVLPLDFKAI